MRESEAAMAKDDPPSVDVQALADKAVLGICEMLGLLFGLPFGEDLYHDKSFIEISAWHWFYLVIGIFFAGGGFLFPWIRTRTWIPERFSASLSRGALDARIWIVSLLILFLYGTGPEIYERAVESRVSVSPIVIHDPATPEQVMEAAKHLPSPPPIVVHDPATPEQIAQAAAAQIREVQERERSAKDQTNIVIRERDSAIKERDNALQRLNALQNPRSSQQSNTTLSQDEITIKTAIWKSVDEELNNYSNVLNRGYVVLDTWQQDVRVDRQKVMNSLQVLVNSSALIKERIRGLRASYMNYSDVADALKQAEYIRSNIPTTIFDKLEQSIGNLWQAIRALPEPLPPNIDNSTSAYSAAFRRDLNAARDWQVITHGIVTDSENELSSTRR